jgi:hypothetical protein
MTAKTPIGLCVLLLSCTATAPTGSATTTAGAAATAPSTAKRPASATKVGDPGPPTGAGGTDELKRLEGKTQEALFSEFGKPTQDREFPMSECCGEFQIELYNTYPPDDPATAQVRIRELTWEYDGYALTVWLHAPDEAWLALDTIRYTDDLEF